MWGATRKMRNKKTHVFKKTSCNFHNHSSLLYSPLTSLMCLYSWLKFLDVIYIIHIKLPRFLRNWNLKRCLWNCQEAHSKSQETNAHVLFARSLQWKSQASPMSCWRTPLIIEFETYLRRGNESKKRHKNHWCMMAPFLGGLVDWPLHTSAINGIQLSNKCQPFQLRTNWWCSLATFAQFLSHEQQHFQNLSGSNYGSYTSCRKVKQNMLQPYRCATATNLPYLFFTDQPFRPAAFEWPQQFWSSEVHQIRHGKIDCCPTISMTEITLFVSMICFGTCSTGYELASVFALGRCWLHCAALATENIPRSLGASQWRFLLLCYGGLLEKETNHLHDNEIMINDKYNDKT